MHPLCFAPIYLWTRSVRFWLDMAELSVQSLGTPAFTPELFDYAIYLPCFGKEGACEVRCYAIASGVRDTIRNNGYVVPDVNAGVYVVTPDKAPAEVRDAYHLAGAFAVVKFSSDGMLSKETLERLSFELAGMVCFEDVSIVDEESGVSYHGVFEGAVIAAE